MINPIFSRPLTQHERLKKDVLSLDYQDFIHLVAIMLHGNEVSIFDLQTTVGKVKTRQSTVATQRALDKLAKAELVYTTWRTVAITQEYRQATVFAADQLQPGHLDMLIAGVNDIKSFPSGESTHSRFGRRYSDIGIRAVHKILQDRSREFKVLYRELSTKSPYLQHERSHALFRAQAVLGTMDWPFWEKRSQYFQDSAWSAFQSNYHLWKEGTAALMEEAFVQLFEDDGNLPEIARAGLILGFEYFKDRQELYPGDFRPTSPIRPHKRKHDR